MLHLHALLGCSPTPLAHYLKALAVLRLVSHQADPQARGFWRDTCFHLATKLSREELLAFFARDYAPTPMLSPWNGGSGFYPKDNQDGIGPMGTAEAPRFACYRAAIAAARALVGDAPESPKDEQKADLLARSIATGADETLAWLASAVVLEADRTPRYPALLGTGGNDGRLDFTNNYMKRLTELFDLSTGEPASETAPLLEQALFRTPARGLAATAVGQFFPGGAGGANATAGFDADSLVNPWDLVFALEGIMVLRVAAVRRLESGDAVQASAPFAFRAVNEGYASASPGDASMRGEQWMPLWDRPSTLPEVDRLFAEARTRSGKKAAKNTLDAMKAVARLGSTRGVNELVRYAYLERNGQANLAVPVGSIRVQHRPQVRLLDEVDEFAYWLRRAGGDGPASLARASRRLDGACLRAASPGANADDWLMVLAAVAAAEDLLVRQPKATVAARLKPCEPLSAGWIDMIAGPTPSPEIEIALAVASQRDHKLGPIRNNMLPLLPGGRRFEVVGDSLARRPGRVWRGRDVVDDLGELALRRCVDAPGAGLEHIALHPRCTASLEAVSAFLEGPFRDDHLGLAIRALACVDFSHVVGRRPQRGSAMPLLGVVKLAYLVEPVGSLQPRLDARPLRLLRAGRLSPAADALARVLRSAGLRPKFRVVVGSASFARRLAAAVAIPLAASDLEHLSKRLAVTTDSQEQPQ